MGRRKWNSAMSKRRSEVVDPTAVQILHIINRCVRRAFLCGVDSVSGQDYSHRRQWLQDRLEYLVRHFAIEIATFSIMSNHFHLVVRTRPDIVSTWSDREVAMRNMKPLTKNPLQTIFSLLKTSISTLLLSKIDDNFTEKSFLFLSEK